MSDQLPARLVFKRPANDGLPAKLVFGDDGEVVVERVILNAGFKLSGIRGFVRGRAGVVLRSSVKLSGIRGFVRGGYDVNVERPLVVQVRHNVQAAQPVNLAGSDRWQDSRAAHVHVQQHLQQAQPVAAAQEQSWQDAQQLQTTMQQRVQQAARLVSVTEQSFQDAVPLHVAAQSRTQQAERLVLVTEQSFQDTVQLHTAVQARQHQAAPLHMVREHAGGSARQFHIYHLEHTQQATRPGIGKRAVVPPVLPEPCHPNLPAQLIFKALAGNALPAQLHFLCCDTTEPELPPAKIIVPVRKAYVVLNEITLRRADNGVAFHALNFSMSLDYQSWTWSWSADLHPSDEPYIGRDADGFPAIVEATINGVPVRLRMLPQAFNQPFLPKRIKVGGKGLGAVLSDRWAPEQTFSNPQDRTAQQLMADVLSVNGVPLGWNIDWGIDDWLVPADTWSIQGRYIDGVQDIANSVGAYIQPHNTAPTLRVLPEYPVAPWHWADVTPDFDLPAGVAVVVDREPQFKSDFNAVWISGVKSGSVSGPFGRTGTAKDKYAPQVVHPLITSATAHRQRGLAVISNTGTPAQVTLNMQVLPETGLILPGKFVRYAGVTGLVRGTSINWSRPALRQQLTLETHPNAS